jgi:hypothetical protein
MQSIQYRDESEQQQGGVIKFVKSSPDCSKLTDDELRQLRRLTEKMETNAVI